MAPNIGYLEIVEWNDHLHPDLTRKVKPPFRWIKLQTENLDMLGDLSLREYGAYCRLINVAALTDNCTIFNQSWIKRRTGITQKDIEKLKNRGLIKITGAPQDSQKTQQKQCNDSNIASVHPENDPQPAALEGRGRDKTRLDMKGLEGTNESPLPELMNSNSLSPPRHAGKRNGHDHRSFDELKALIIPVTSKLNTSDPEQIFRMAGQSLRMTEKQIRTAVGQLVEDGEI